MSETIIVKAKLKELVKGYNVSGDFAEALDGKVRGLIQDAMKRAEANNRKTVMSKDI